MDDDDDDDRFSQPHQPNYNSNVHKVVPLSKNAPYSIASAIRDHRYRQCQCSSSSNDGNNYSAMRTTTTSWSNDIVAVILSATTRYAPNTNTPTNSMMTNHYYKNTTCTTLLLGDQSLPPGQCARVTVPASSCSNLLLSTSNNYLPSSLVGVDGRTGGERLVRSEIRSSTLPTTPTKSNAQSTLAGRWLGELQPGDVVRLNRLEVRRDYDHGREATGDNKNNDDNYDASHHHLLRVACDFAMSWKDPSPGPTLARLCRIIPKSSSKVNNNNNIQSAMPSNQNQCYDYDLEWERIIPPSMETSKATVMELASWYCSNDIASRYYSKSTTIFHATQRCQRRRLRDITAPNMISHIVVKVLRCEKAVVSIIFASPIKGVTEDNSDVTHVTLSDGLESDDILGMVGLTNNNGQLATGGIVGAKGSTIPKSISSVILQAMNDGAHVILTHVLSSHASLGSNVCASSSLILVPTRETTATILTHDHPYFVHAPPQQHSIREDDLTSLDSQHLFGTTQSQQSANDRKIDTTLIPSSIQSRGVMTITAPLLDIIVNGIETSFMEGSHCQSPYALSRFLIDMPRISTRINSSLVMSPSYRSATLILDRTSKSVLVEKGHDGEHDKNIVVHACGDAMKLLCMDVPAEDMVMMMNGTTPAVATAPHHHPYLNRVGALLRTLCAENIPIQWVLEQESECNWFVVNATIIEL